MKATLKFTTYSLNFRHPFRIAAGSRISTDTVFVVIEWKGLSGYGACSLPPYLHDSTKSVLSFLELAKEKKIIDPTDISGSLNRIDQLKPGNHPAKAALDIAMHDLLGKTTGSPVYQKFDIDPAAMPLCTYTIGISDPSELEQKLELAKNFGILKLKLGSANDTERILLIRKQSRKQICADVNQGWNDRIYARDMSKMLHEMGCLFLEQPFPQHRLDDMAWLSGESPIPIIADESFQTMDDLDSMRNVCHGINIKLMKCGGITHGYEILKKAKEYKLKTLIGSMSESACSIAGAAQLAPLADWADLDGPLLIANDPFGGIDFDKGKIVLTNSPGNGSFPLKKLFSEEEVLA